MGFKDIKSKAIQCLKSKNYLAQNREKDPKKNLLAIGEIDADEVIKILMLCNGMGYSFEKLHANSKLQAHIFKTKEWYIKLYFIGPDCYIISVHLNDKN